MSFIFINIVSTYLSVIVVSSIYLSIYLSIHLFIYIFTYLSVYFSIYLSIFLSICLFFYLSISLYLSIQLIADLNEEVSVQDLIIHVRNSDILKAFDNVDPESDNYWKKKVNIKNEKVIIQFCLRNDCIRIFKTARSTSLLKKASHRILNSMIIYQMSFKFYNSFPNILLHRNTYQNKNNSI